MERNSHEAIELYALDHGEWQRVQSNLRLTLASHQLEHLAAPSSLILHDLLDSAVRLMHLQVFRHIMEADFGLAFDGDETQVESLFKSETGEHGLQNIAHACRQLGRHVTLSFPPRQAGEASVLAELTIPVRWDKGLCQTATLIEALGFRLDCVTDKQDCWVRLIREIERPAPFIAPTILDTQAAVIGIGQIAEQLAYGLIVFSSVGEITAVSPSMLRLLRLEEQNASLSVLAEAIPLGFLNDIIWGLALADGNGGFENYRIRVRLPSENSVSVLFNVSGYRRSDGTITSMWQTVSLDEGSTQLAEGSILSEVRIHNITRHYVPQLVERKARDAVRLGKTSLSNEERPVAVLFCDIVGFTSYVELHAASESTIDTLNSILRRISGSVRRNNGSIDKFMGDCIMAIFDDPAEALLAAIDMQGHSEDINNLRDRAGQYTLQLRIGIHWGLVVIGNVGTPERLDWTAIGDVVNTASRIEKNCQPGLILISSSTRDAIEAIAPGRFNFEQSFELQVKGKAGALSVCHVKPS